MVKFVSFFLIAMLVLAMFGRLRVPGTKGRKLSKPGKCPHCGRYRIGPGKCQCEDRR
ncbi:short-chain dehydrogenase [Defluviimonas sp. 20V17]|uniref:Uncharacterized protein n=1 Tax=Allgaiera indica TaxID=765699 RepID=A0AAN4UNW6_9RHOB|nr:hypothetical protein [Allgaiera indica]KDB05263.1 short-chain dehydrogenase [Defluviimonas sp. 20V17]GHD99022.1 hypothetical protein GCM10008024_04880 [Allgaiera indica]SDW01770.1 hypothetical protein SAMN05444006_10160 [Allgaiera indica]